MLIKSEKELKKVIEIILVRRKSLFDSFTTLHTIYIHTYIHGWMDGWIDII